MAQPLISFSKSPRIEKRLAVSHHHIPKPPCAKGARLQAPISPSLLCVKGGGAALAVTEELSVHTVDL